ncbi:MAG: fused MFS/spermidine synthase [Erythrobacter sp.]|nr:fused MFS/spermidine synthase [Erythrobacter sp.]
MARSLVKARLPFVAAILAGSFLLFLVQPLVARMALPRLGGAPAVWNSAMLVYQALLLGGYAYAHALSRLALRRQFAVHLALLLIAGLTLPISLADLAPPAEGWETLWVPLLLLLTIGPVFFAVSAQAPLIQRWYAADRAAGDPYWLYAASNLGSFAGLLAYPLLLEPNLSLAGQSRVWSVGYGILVLLVALVAWCRRDADTGAAEPVAENPAPEPIGRRRIVLWLALSAVPSGLMLSTTMHLTTDIVAMPLLWVMPLGLYLLSFVFAFNERSHLGYALARSAPIILLLAGGMAMVGRGGGAASTAFATLLMLFVVAVALHRRLYAERPSPERLTLFYLVMSAGGALGGLFTAIVAPVVFDWTWEHPLLVLAAAALLPGGPLLGWAERLHVRTGKGRVAIIGILIAVIALALLLYRAVLAQDDLAVLGLMVAISALSLLLIGQRLAFVAALLALMLGRGGFDTIGSAFEGMRERSYFGTYAVRENEMPGLRGLTHGTTLHGLQFADPERAREPTTYYTRTSGVGLALDNSVALAGPQARIGVIGLGVGTLACYRAPGQAYEFFEIDPAIVAHSRDGTFTYLRDCAPDAAIHVGDARLELETMGAARFDILVLDAFSSDSIPLHLFTREAFGIYRRAIDADGLLLVHISSRYVDLQPMIAGLARANGMQAAIREDLEVYATGASPSIWVALSPDPATMAALRETGGPGAWEDLPPPPDRVWTDDFASILPFLQWNNVLGRGP